METEKVGEKGGQGSALELKIKLYLKQTPPSL